MAFTLTPNMNLPVPTVGSEPGPDYATDINACLSILDGHTHSAGSGAPITPDGLTISSDLTFLNNNATNLRSVRMLAQPAALGLAADLDCLFVTGVDLYFNDGNGNHVRITQSGGVAGSPGSISGLTSPASASYVSGSETFVWQSNTNKPANLDAGFIKLRNNVANSKALTLVPPSAMGADYTLTLPTLPSVQSIMTLDASGNIAAPYTVDNSTITIASNIIGVPDSGITTNKIADANVTTAKIADLNVTTAKIANSNVTLAKIANLNYVFSTSGVSTTNTTTTPLLVTSVAITASGLRPIMIALTPFGSAANSYVGIANAANTSAAGTFYIRLGASVIMQVPLIATGGGAGTEVRHAVSAFSMLDLTAIGSAGSKTYSVYISAASGTTITTLNFNLVAYEIT